MAGSREVAPTAPPRILVVGYPPRTSPPRTSLLAAIVGDTPNLSAARRLGARQKRRRAQHRPLDERIGGMQRR